MCNFVNFSNISRSSEGSYVVKSSTIDLSFDLLAVILSCGPSAASPSGGEFSVQCCSVMSKH